MELLDNLIFGFSVALTPQNLLFCFIGALVGTLIGVLPGIGPLATLAMLLPMTFYLPPVPALIMLAGIYYGAQYGGSTTAILVNMPGESSSVVTCLDGHQMARKGRAGAALAIAALGSLFAGTVATVLHRGREPAAVAARAEIPGAGIFLADGARPRRLDRAGARLGAQGGRDGAARPAARAGRHRHQFRPRALHLRPAGAVATASASSPVAMGLFGVAEILVNLEKRDQRARSSAVIGSLMPTREEFRQAGPAVLRGTALGSILGVLPGGGALLALVRGLCVREEDVARARRASARARSRASRRPKPPTTPARRPRSFRC